MMKGFPGANKATIEGEKELPDPKPTNKDKILT